MRNALTSFEAEVDKLFRFLDASNSEDDLVAAILGRPELDRADLKCVHFDTKNFSNSRSSSNLGHNRETNRCGSALIRSMKALQASKRWRMEA